MQRSLEHAVRTNSCICPSMSVHVRHMWMACKANTIHASFDISINIYQRSPTSDDSPLMGSLVIRRRTRDARRLQGSNSMVSAPTSQVPPRLPGYTFQPLSRLECHAPTALDLVYVRPTRHPLNPPSQTSPSEKRPKNTWPKRGGERTWAVVQQASGKASSHGLGFNAFLQEYRLYRSRNWDRPKRFVRED